MLAKDLLQRKEEEESVVVVEEDVAVDVEVAAPRRATIADKRVTLHASVPMSVRRIVGPSTRPGRSTVAASTAARLDTFRRNAPSLRGTKPVTIVAKTDTLPANVLSLASKTFLSQVRFKNG